MKANANSWKMGSGMYRLCLQESCGLIADYKKGQTHYDAVIEKFNKIRKIGPAMPKRGLKVGAVSKARYAVYDATYICREHILRAVLPDR